MSGFGARSGQLFPFGRTTSWEKAGTDEMRLASQAAAPRIVARSCPALDGQEVDPREFVEPFVQGFRQAYELIAARRDEFTAPGGWLERFGDDEVRFVARSPPPTANYFALPASRPAQECHRPRSAARLAVAGRPAAGLPRRLIAAEAEDIGAAMFPFSRPVPGPETCGPVGVNEFRRCSGSRR